MQSSCNHLYLHVRMPTVIKLKICQNFRHLTGLHMCSLRFRVSPCQPGEKPRTRGWECGTLFSNHLFKTVEQYLVKSHPQVSSCKTCTPLIFSTKWYVFFYWLLSKEVLNVRARPPHLSIRKSRKVFCSEIAKVSEWTQTALLRVFRSLFTAIESNRNPLHWKPCSHFPCFCALCTKDMANLELTHLWNHSFFVEL